MLTIRAMSDGREYSSRHLEHSDYYAEGERVVGRWQGRGAELLGLAGEVKLEDFESVREGVHPQSGEFLRQRQGADRLAAHGTIQSRARNLYDFTFSAPKSVSIMAILGDDKRLMAAHQKAVTSALQELERHAAARVRQNGANEDRTTGNLAIAVYHHDTSRELDPQLHTHAVAANLTYDGVECRWKALQASGIYQRRAYLTEVYRNCLAREVRLLGYEIENRCDSRCRDRGFEIKGISDELITKFSQRSRQRDEAIDDFVEKYGRQPSDNEIAVLVRESRADKLVEISTNELRARQRGRLTEDERRALAAVRATNVTPTIELDAAEPSFEYAQQHIFERVSVVQDHSILTEALRHGRGRISNEELKGVLALKRSQGAIVQNETELATVESLKRERDMIRRINRGVGIFDRLDRGGQFVAPDGLRPEQNDVLEFVLRSRDRAMNIRGAAGTGKTATLQGLRTALRRADRDLIAIAPTMSAVEELQKVGFNGAITVERFLEDQRIKRAIDGKVVIVDEAGMISGRQMSELLCLAEEHGLRLVFCGDTKQIQSVEACDALRILEQESRMKSVSLTQVQRQKVKGYREAIEELRKNPDNGLEKLEAIGAIREVPWLQRAEHVAQVYREQQSRKESVLVVCPTHDEIGRVTDAIRSARKLTGELAQETQVEQHLSMNWTTAQKTDPGNFRPGQVLRFHRAVRGFLKNATAEVIRIEDKYVIVRREDGRESAVTAKQAKAFDVFERRFLKVAPSDKLLLMANRHDPNFKATNGEIVTVSHVDKRRRVHLEDGRVLPANFNQFTHGYAVTAHRSQGKSVDSVIISGDGMRTELFYVAASRGRKRVLVITSDKEGLRESVACSTARRSASELVRRVRSGLHQGLHRGREAARKLVRRSEQLKSLLEQQSSLTHFRKQRKVERTHDQSIGR